MAIEFVNVNLIRTKLRNFGFFKATFIGFFENFQQQLLNLLQLLIHYFRNY